MRSLAFSRRLLHALPGLSSGARRECASCSSDDSVDALRNLLRQHHQATDEGLRDRGHPFAGSILPPTNPSGTHAAPGTSIAAQTHSTNYTEGMQTGSSDGSNGSSNGKASSVSGMTNGDIATSAALIKELLRIFTRKVPGGLVPDGLVRGLMQAYSELRGPEQRLAFFRLLISEMGLSASEVSSAVRVWNTAASRADAATAAAPVTVTAGDAPSPDHATSPPEGFHDALYRAADRLASACQPLYTQLFLPVSQAPEGMKFLVDMRADLMRLAASLPHPAEAAPLRAMADHLRQSLAEWFSVGLLHLQPISWQESPAALLERVMAAEAVHPLAGWAELRRRLGPRRRVFAFTHPSMPGEPLVVLHTALTERAATSMEEILGPSGNGTGSGADAAASPSDGFSASTLTPPPPAPSAAVFYSISASQPGLRGIELGHFLIKRVAELLLAQHPSLRQLVTLSPLPNFRSWLTSRLRQEQQAAARQATQLQQAVHQSRQQGPAQQQAQQQTQQQQAGSPTPQAVETQSQQGSPTVDSPLLRPAEAEAVVRLALDLGWQPAGGATGAGGAGPYRPDPAGPARPAAAAAALCWLLDGDRWLAPTHRTPSTGGGGSGSDCEARLAPAPPRHASVPALAQRSDPAQRDTPQYAGADGASPSAAAAAGGGAGCGAAAVLRPLLLRLAARYLAVEKRRRFALCPVAHFHLRNGASLWRLNWGADMSPLGLQRSCGIMVNYDYSMPTMYDNNRQYLLLHKVQVHPQVLELLQAEEPAGQVAYRQA